MRIKALYAGRMRRLFNRLRREAPRDLPVPKRDPLDLMLLGILQRGTTASRAEATLAHLLDHVVDHNDLRVTPARDTVEYLQDRIPQAADKAQYIRSALNGVFDKLNNLNLVPLREKPKKEAREFLESIPGTDPYTVASVLLVGLGHSAFPVSDHLLSVLQQQSVLPQEVDTPTIQTWLERHLPAAEAGAFFRLMQSYAAAKAPRWSAAAAPEPPPSTQPATPKPAGKKAAATKTTNKRAPRKPAAKRRPTRKASRSTRRAGSPR